MDEEFIFLTKQFKRYIRKNKFGGKKFSYKFETKKKKNPNILWMKQA